jgi:serine/threonine protein kinase
VICSPNVIHLFGLYTSSNGLRFIVMEFMRSGSLLAALKQHRDEIQLRHQLKMMAQVCSGMVYLSEKQIIHRDLAARNILAEREDDKWMCKVSDFGLAKAMQSSTSQQVDEVSIPVKW